MGIQIVELCKLTCTILAILCSLVFTGTVIGLLRRLEGCCLLFASGDWIVTASTNSSGSQSLLALQCGSECTCTFSIVCGCFSIASAGYFLIAISRTVVRQKPESWLHSFGSVMYTVLLLILLLAGVVISHLGFDAYCELITAQHPGSSCSIAEYSSTIHKNYYNTSSIDPDDAEWKVFGGAHLFVFVSILCQWLTIFAWLIYAAVCCVQLSASTKRERFIDTLRRERTRVWQRVTRTRFYSKFHPESPNELDCGFSDPAFNDQGQHAPKKS